MLKTLYETWSILTSIKQVGTNSFKVIADDGCNWFNSSLTKKVLSQYDSHRLMWDNARHTMVKYDKKNFNKRNYHTKTRFYSSSKSETIQEIDLQQNSISNSNSISISKSNAKSNSKSNPKSNSKSNAKSNTKSNSNSDANSNPNSINNVIGANKTPQVQLNQSQVPSTRLSRIFHYGQLAAGMTYGAATSGLKHLASGNTHQVTMKSLLLSPANIERMAKKFSKMRGAALKIGQMMSFQDNSILPAEIQQILLKVQNSAHYMPANQLYKVMESDLGRDWRERLFTKFDDYPIAAASIGQVHNAITKDLTPVVVKVQYPGVVDSIDSDLNNLLMLLTASSLLPKGLFLDKTIANARTELKWECDYIKEAQSLIRFRELIKFDPVFQVPRVFHNICGEHVLTMEKMNGIEIIKGNWDQKTKDWIATQIMKLTLTEIKLKFMQTDPNWANFLYNESTKKIELLDFGAAREFPDEFTHNYIQVLRAAIKKDRKGVEKYSKILGYLTGLESQNMIDCHVDSVMVLGECFSPIDNKGQPFNFAQQTITDRVRGNISVMLNERLTPPPEETYSLHRKLSGVFLLCARLNATVPCEQLFRDIIGFEDETH